MLRLLHKAHSWLTSINPALHIYVTHSAGTVSVPADKLHIRNMDTKHSYGETKQMYTRLVAASHSVLVTYSLIPVGNRTLLCSPF